MKPQKCQVCGFDKFEFILEKQVEQVGVPTHDIGYYKCKRCGSK